MQTKNMSKKIQRFYFIWARHIMKMQIMLRHVKYSEYSSKNILRQIFPNWWLCVWVIFCVMKAKKMKQFRFTKMQSAVTQERLHCWGNCVLPIFRQNDPIRMNILRQSRFMMKSPDSIRRHHRQKKHCSGRD